MKFPCDSGDTTDTCDSMQHKDTMGAFAHMGVTLHLFKDTDETCDFVVSKL